MGILNETFTNKHIILPVIHIETGEQVEHNLKIVQESGCDGAFLIDEQERGHERLRDVYRYAREGFPDFWIGLNYQDLSAEAAFLHLPDDASGVWIDNAGIAEDDQEQQRAKAIRLARERSGWQGLYFGGVAFKYQKPVSDLEKTTKIAEGYVDVVTTSGQGTGFAAEISKIQTMKNALSQTPLAIASGISPENVINYLDYADCFLVASSLLIPSTENFDPTRVQALVRTVRAG